MKLFLKFLYKFLRITNKFYTTFVIENINLMFHCVKTQQTRKMAECSGNYETNKNCEYFMFFTLGIETEVFKFQYQFKNKFR